MWGVQPRKKLWRRARRWAGSFWRVRGAENDERGQMVRSGIDTRRGSIGRGLAGDRCSGADPRVAGFGERDYGRNRCGEEQSSLFGGLQRAHSARDVHVKGWIEVA